MGETSRLLVTGASGQVGSALRALIPEADFRSHAELDVRDREMTDAAMRGKELVVHLAALTDVDRCEIDKELAFSINADGTRNVVEAARSNDAIVIFVSTDYVFSGDHPCYREDDAPQPLNVYGRSKLAGEAHLEAERGDLTVRTSWIFGDGRNFVRSILGAARRGPVRVVNDQFGRPTAATDLAVALGALMGSSHSGIVHVTGDGPPCSWADFAREAITYAGMDSPVEGIDTSTYVRSSTKVVAPRPRDSTLCLDRARELGVPLGDWRSSLQSYVGSVA